MKLAGNLFLMTLLGLVIYKETGSISVPVLFFLTWTWIAIVRRDLKNTQKFTAQAGRLIRSMKLNKGDRNGKGKN